MRCHGNVIKGKDAHLRGRRGDDERGRVAELIQGEQSATDGKGVDKRSKQRQAAIKKPNGGGDKQYDDENTDKACHADRDMRVTEGDVMRVFGKTAGDGKPDDPDDEYDGGQGQKYDLHWFGKADLFQREDFCEREREHIEQNANKNGNKKVFRPGQAGQRIIERRLLPPCDDEQADSRRNDKHERRQNKSQKTFFPYRFRRFEKRNLSHNFMITDYQKIINTGSSAPRRGECIARQTAFLRFILDFIDKSCYYMRAISACMKI